MNISIKQVTAFVAIADSLSFAEASAKVFLSQPALSISIRKLEQELGGKLFARTTRSVSLTPEGSAFLPVAKRLLADWENACVDVQNLFTKQRGKLTIAAMPSFAANQLPRSLVNYRSKYPNINIIVEDVVAEQVVSVVQSGRVEIGISFDSDFSDDLEFTPLFEDKFLAVLPAGHTLARAKSINWQSLSKYPFIALQKPSRIRWQIDATLAKTNITLPVELESHQLATIGRMVASGLGVSAIPALCKNQMEEMGAVCRPLTGPAISRQVGILTRRRYPLSAAGQAMIESLRAEYQSGRI